MKGCDRHLGSQHSLRSELGGVGMSRTPLFGDQVQRRQEYSVALGRREQDPARAHGGDAWTAARPLQSSHLVRCPGVSEGLCGLTSESL